MTILKKNKRSAFHAPLIAKNKWVSKGLAIWRGFGGSAPVESQFQRAIPLAGFGGSAP